MFVLEHGRTAVLLQEAVERCGDGRLEVHFLACYGMNESQGLSMET